MPDASSRRRLLAAFLCGALALYGLRVLINQTTFADYIVAPLVWLDTEGRADAIVVLGAGVVGECGTNLNGVRRVLLGARKWREGRAPVVVFTGGRGGDDPSCSVAVAMARLAEEVGVPRSAIHLETGSRTTRENGELSLHLLRWLGASRLLIVTDKLHMPRASGVFGHLGFSVERASVPIFESHTDNVSMLTAGFREMLALRYYRMRGWMADPPQSTEPARTEPTTNGQVKMQSDGPVVILGASYAGGWDIARIGRVPVINQGIAGQQSFEMLERFERDVVSKQPRVVILWGFINDLFRSPVDSMDATLNRVRDSYLQMVSLARRHGITPIIATEVTIRSPDSWRNTLASWAGWLRGKEGYQDRVNRHVRAVNRWLVDLARRENLLLLDLQSTLSEQGGARRKEYTQEDGSHISRVGYTALSEYAEPILAQYLERP